MRSLSDQSRISLVRTLTFSFPQGLILQVTSKVANRINGGRPLSKKLAFVCVTAVKSLIVLGFYLALVLVVYLNGRHVALQRLMDYTLGN